jgi:hypothetical protein
MTRLRFRVWTSAALFLALALIPTVWAEKPVLSLSYTSSEDSPEQSYKIYSLDVLGSDASFGEWIAQTIPEVIAPGSWKGPGVIRYYAPRNILVVSHSPAVQAKVDVFLKDMKKALPGKKTAAAAHKRSARNNHVIPASYQEPALLKGSPPVAESSPTYPVPAQARTPKHLFHFIIRYEGEGLVDDNIVKAMKAYYLMEKKASEATTPTASYSGQATPPPGPAAPNPSAPATGTAPVSTLPATVGSTSAPVTEKEEKKEETKEEKKEKKEEKKDKEKKKESPPAA